MQLLSQRYNGLPTFDNLLALDDGFQWIITSYIMHIATSDHGNVSPLCLRGVCQHGPRRTRTCWWQTREFIDQYGILRYVRSRLPCEFLSIDTNARNCRCLCGLRIITKAYSQASSARRSSVSIAQPPLGMTPWSFEYWRLALDFHEKGHIGWYMGKYGGTWAKNSEKGQNRGQNLRILEDPLSLSYVRICT